MGSSVAGTIGIICKSCSKKKHTGCTKFSCSDNPVKCDCKCKLYYSGGMSC